MLNRKGFILGALAAGVVLLTGCDGSGAGGGDSFIRFVNAVPGGQSLDAYVDGGVVASNTTALTTSSAIRISSGTRVIRLYANGTTTSPLVTTSNSTNDATYSYVVYGTPTALQTLVLQDDTTTVNNNRARVTVAHVAPAAGNVDVYITAPTDDITTATATLTNLAPGNYTTIGTVASGTYRVRITPTGTKTVVIDSGTTGVSLTAGSVYNVFATQAGTTAAPANVLIEQTH